MKNPIRGFPSMTQVLIHVFDQLPDNIEFSGWQLKNMVVKAYPEARHIFPDTILRRLRHCRRWQFIAIDPNKSKYRKIKPVFGKGINNAIDLRKKVKQREKV